MHGEREILGMSPGLEVIFFFKLSSAEHEISTHKC